MNIEGLNSITSEKIPQLHMTSCETMFILRNFVEIIYIIDIDSVSMNLIDIGTRSQVWRKEMDFRSLNSRVSD
jgi:hypothetical protein